jgi:Na+/glutamate symporter
MSRWILALAAATVGAFLGGYAAGVVAHILLEEHRG